jgi:copper(I)-binding protein
MLMKPKQPLKAGDRVEINLQFKDGESMTVTHEVRAGAGGMNHGAMGGMAGMDHGQMKH